MLRSIVGAVLFLAIGTRGLPAAESSPTPHLFGSYIVVQATCTGRETELELRMRLVNPSGQAVSIEKVTLMSVRPKALGTWPAARLLKAHGTQETTQEFKISTPEYQSWEKGLRPLVRVEMRTEKGQRTSQTVRLNGVPLQ